MSSRVADLPVVIAAIALAALAAGPPVAGATPAALAVGRDRVFVADADRVRVLTRDGAPVREWTVGEAARGACAGIAIGAGGNVIVADAGNGRIQAFTQDGQPLAQWPAGRAPMGVAVDAAGNVYATDLDEGIVRRWSAAGEPVASWSERAGAGVLRDPWGIAVAATGELLVADHGNHRIVRLSPAGEVLGTWGVRGRTAGRLFGPMGVAVARDGSVLVTDLAGARVQRFTAAGEPLASGLGSGMDDAALLAGIAADGDEAVVVDAVSGGIASVSWGSVPASDDVPPTGAPVAGFRLVAVEPVPSMGPVRVRLIVPARGTVTGAVFAVDGRRVATLPAVSCEAGERVLTWDGRTAHGQPSAAGVYHLWVDLDSGGERVSRHARAVVLR